MASTAACPALSLRTRTAAIPDQSTPDQQAWQTFLHHEQTPAWLRQLIRWRLACREDDHRLDHLVTSAWLKLATSTRYRLGLGGVQQFAYAFIEKTIRGDRVRQRRWCRRQNALEEMDSRNESSPVAQWDEDHRSADGLGGWFTVTAVREALSLVDDDARPWGETYLSVMIAPTDPHVTGARPDPIRRTEERLGWTRYACDRARAHLEHAMATLRPMDPRP